MLRDDLPRYPPLLQLLRVTSTILSGPGGSSTAGGLFSNIYVSYTEQLTTDDLAPRDREPCLVLDTNSTGLVPGYYLGRLAGSFGGLPVYEAIGTPSLVRVTGTTLVDDCLFPAELVARNGCDYTSLQVVWLKIEGPNLVGPPPWVPDVGDVHVSSPQGQRLVDLIPVYVANDLPTNLACPQIPGLTIDDLPTEHSPDFLVGYKGGCLVKVPTSTC